MGTTVQHDLREHRRTRRNPRGMLAASLAVGLGGELIVPWTILGLSNWLFFDVPRWAMWILFAVPILLAAMTPLLAPLMRSALVVSRRQDGMVWERPALLPPRTRMERRTRGHGAAQ